MCKRDRKRNREREREKERERERERENENMEEGRSVEWVHWGMEQKKGMSTRGDR